MSCACVNGYVCFECEREIDWGKLSTDDKLLLCEYSELLEKDKFNLRLFDEINGRGLCISMMPNSAKM